jgi:FixJ family two-component response regulator
VDDALVFLVDDDEAVRDAVATALRAAGYGGQRGALVVVDLDLPGVERDLLGSLARAEVALPVIVTSRRLRWQPAPAVGALKVALSRSRSASTSCCR